MKNIRDSLKLFRYNRGSVLLFEGILLLVSYTLFIPALGYFFNLSIKYSGLRYISKENIPRYFKSPITYVFLIVLIILISFFLLVNVSGIIYAYDAANDLKKIGPFRIFFKGLRNAVRMIRPRNMLIVPYMMFLFPVSGVAVVSVSYVNLGIPPYLSQLINASPLSISLVGMVYLIMSLIVMSSIYSIYEFSLRRESFITSLKLGRKDIKKEKLLNFLQIVLWNVTIVFLIILLNGVILTLLRKTANTFISSGNALTIVYGILDMINFVLVGILTIIALPLNFSIISNSYYNLYPNKEGIPNIDDLDNYASKISGKKGRRIVAVILILAVILDAGYIFLRRMDIIGTNVLKVNTAYVTAHRGASYAAPENTLSSFSLAMEDGADFIELDVRQTKDGEIVVMHDENVKRTCGVDKKVGNMTLDEIKSLSAGKKFSKKFKDEKVPTLKEALLLIGDSAVVNVELKPAKTDTDLVEKVIDIIYECGQEDNVVIASTSSKALMKTKELDDSFKTVYIMQLAYGNFYDMDFVDIYSVKYTFVNYEMVKKVHRMGKEIYVWTVDDREVVEQMLYKNVDNIITNNPKFVRETESSLYEEGSLYDIISTYIEKKTPEF